MTSREERRRQAELRTVYRNAWDILGTWIHCRCAPGECPLENELARLGTDMSSLLEAAALGQPEWIGVGE